MKDLSYKEKRDTKTLDSSLNSEKKLMVRRLKKNKA